MFLSWIWGIRKVWFYFVSFNSNANAVVGQTINMFVVIILKSEKKIQWTILTTQAWSQAADRHLLQTWTRSFIVFSFFFGVWLVFQRWPVVLRKLCISSLNKGCYECALRWILVEGLGRLIHPLLFCSVAKIMTVFIALQSFWMNLKMCLWHFQTVIFLLLSSCYDYFLNSYKRNVKLNCTQT